MRKKLSLFCLFISIFALIFSGLNTAYADDQTKIYLGGMPAGFTLFTKGAHIVGLCDVITEDGLKSPAKDCEIKVGDVIIAINNYEINNAKDIENAIKDQKQKNIYLNRDGKILVEKIVPAKDINGTVKLGVFVKDTVSGIGTITYIKGNRFASLGHPVADENGKILSVSGGELYNCNISGLLKGKRGKAGELHGVFFTNKKIAEIDKNDKSGVYGTIDKNTFDYKNLIEIGIGNASVGDAHIYSTINGDKPLKYDISIVKIDNNNDIKNFVIKVNDDRLIENTGGIVQGMSGSPIVQNNKLVGAVTHVFINDPTRGFGISIKNMINN